MHWHRRSGAARTERGVLDAGGLAAAVGALLAATTGAVSAMLGWLPLNPFPAAVLTGALGAALGVLVACWRALDLETPGTTARDPRDAPSRGDTARTGNEGANTPRRRPRND